MVYRHLNYLHSVNQESSFRLLFLLTMVLCLTPCVCIWSQFIFTVLPFGEISFHTHMGSGKWQNALSMKEGSPGGTGDSQFTMKYNWNWLKEICLCPNLNWSIEDGKTEHFNQTLAV